MALSLFERLATRPRLHEPRGATGAEDVDGPWDEADFRLMLRCVIIGAVALVGLLAGCKSSTSDPASVRPGPAVGAERAALPLASSPSDLSVEQAAAAHAHYGAGVIHEMNGEMAAALEEYEEAARQDPGNEWVVLEVSDRLIRNKELQRAQAILRRAADRSPASGAIFARLGMVYSHLGKTDQAIEASRIAIKKSPKLLAGYRNLFLNYIQTKQLEEASKALDEAASQKQVEPEFLLGLSELYVSLGLHAPAQRESANARALATLERVDERHPQAPQVRMKLADGFNLLGKSERAAQLYLEVLKNLPEIPFLREQIHAKLADIYLRGSDKQKALDQLKEVVRQDPTNPLAYYYLGSLAYDQKQTAEAADYFSKTVLLSPDFEQAYYDLAMAQLSLNKPAEALATLEKARDKFSERSQNFVLEFWTAMAYSQQKDYRAALRHFTVAEVIAKATDPKRLTQFFYFQYGAAAERQGEYDEAEKHFLRCLELAPDFAEAMNYLGYMWAQQDRKLDKARELIEKALKAEPKNAAYLDSLGWVFFKLHQPQQALEYVLKAVTNSEQPEAEIYDHLGDIYQALDQGDQAREAWRKSLAVETNAVIQQKLEGKPASKPGKPDKELTDQPR